MKHNPTLFSHWKYQATTQQSMASSITSTVQSSTATLTQWNTAWRQELPQFLLDIQTVYTKGLAVLALVNSTQV